jgi:hypothetical protein
MTAMMAMRKINPPRRRRGDVVSFGQLMVSGNSLPHSFGYCDNRGFGVLRARVTQDCTVPET